ncbi:hypothetical protein B0H21DRAFT_60474 [Amylocystis lapponica]|nr:hypothetical protein B0H21DRAFT_60474 [Amylocystis lapponica]
MPQSNARLSVKLVKSSVVSVEPQCNCFIPRDQLHNCITRTTHVSSSCSFFIMPTPVPLDSLLGAAFIGIIISTVIYGINCLQVYLYYAHHCSNDHRLLKTFVAAVITCDTVHVALISAAYYYYVVTKFGDSPALENIVWSLWMQVAIGGCREEDLCPGGNLLCLGQFACLLVYIVDGFKFGSFVHLPPNAPTIAALALGILGDLIIAAGMLFHLRKKRSTFKNTNRGLNLLITYALNTCLLTTLSSAACMISWIMKPHTLIYALFYFILIRLHTCSLMSTHSVVCTSTRTLSILVQ